MLQLRWLPVAEVWADIFFYPTDTNLNLCETFARSLHYIFLKRILGLYCFDSSVLAFLLCFWFGIAFWIDFLKDGTPTTKTFDHLLSEIGAEEAEEVGVEHLLRL